MIIGNFANEFDVVPFAQKLNDIILEIIAFLFDDFIGGEVWFFFFRLKINGKPETDDPKK